MICYFSGTGNSAYVAKVIGEQINDEVVNLFDKLKNHDYTIRTSNKLYVFVVPTYAWQIPHIVRDWILNTEFEKNQKVYFVLTCGVSIGNAEHYLANLCKKKNLVYMGCTDIVMPENYIAMFDVPDKKTAQIIVQNASGKIQDTADIIKSEARIPDNKISIGDKIRSSLVNTMLYSCFISAKKFYATNACISCAHCVNVCPMSNIKMVDGKPNYGKNCTHCMACICTCPKEAIEYGTKSQGKPRYHI
jgi:flavodoxin/NAD-dependent dihydropyrimidine dehydrogenase PreA subunit